MDFDPENSLFSEKPSPHPNSQHIEPIHCIAVEEVHLKIDEVRKIGPSSILLKWHPKVSALSIDGYEVCQHGEIINRVFNSNRCICVVDNIKPVLPTTLEIYATCLTTRYEPPSIITFTMGRDFY